MEKRKAKNLDFHLDAEEQEITAALNQAIDRSKLRSIAGLKEEIAFAKKAAANFLRKDERVTLRISSVDLERLKQKAAYKGLPYQTFIASVLHEYAAGHFEEV